jgi:hypothetical protein
MNEVELFIKKYDQQVFDGDVTSIAQFYYSPFLFTNEKGTWFVNNDSGFEKNLSKSFLDYHDLGAKYCKMVDYECNDLGMIHTVISITWGLFNSEDEALLSFEVSYGVKNFDDGYKFIFVVDHNEDDVIQKYINS